MLSTTLAPVHACVRSAIKTKRAALKKGKYKCFVSLFVFPYLSSSRPYYLYFLLLLDIAGSPYGDGASRQPRYSQ